MNIQANIKKLIALNAEKEALRQSMMRSLQTHSDMIAGGGAYSFCIHDHANPIEVSVCTDLFSSASRALFAITDAGSVISTRPGDYDNTDIQRMLDIIVSWLSDEATAS